MVRGTPDFYRAVQEKGTETRFYHRYGPIAKYASVTLFDLPGLDITIEMLELGTDNNDKIHLWIRPYKIDGTLDVPIYLASRDGAARRGITPYEIKTHESILFYELIYDTTNNYYKFGLGYSLRFSNGVQLTVDNIDALDHHVAVMCLIQIRS